MAYIALYRKFRPLKFSDMVGENHITTTLKNQIIAGRVGHAYLFSGGRGTGKTTSAKILARAVNCLNSQDGEPCNECEICKEMLEGSLTDIVEMDAASNNGVDDVRQIRDEVNFLPTKAKYRVYIIDEVHMLSQGAFNALLKTLEEPPEHVKFILATTEPHKLPATILSRCQRFDFKKITSADIVKRLKIICKESDIKITDEALNLISILAEGAMRDGISILERCCQETAGEITVDLVKELVGIPSLEYISKLVKAIFNHDEILAIQTTEEVINSGKDINNFLWEVIKYIKDVLIYKSTKKLDLYSQDELKEIDEISSLLEKQEILQIIYDLSELENAFRFSTQKNIMFETGIIKACMPKQAIQIESKMVKETKPKTEKQIDKKKTEVKEESVKQEAIKEEVKQVEINQEPKKEEPKEEVKQIADSSDSKDVNWNAVIDECRKTGKMRLYTSLANTRVVQNGDMILDIVFPNGLTSFYKANLEDSTNKKDLEEIIFKQTGKQWHIRLKDGKIDDSNKKPKQNDDLGININILD